jgi:hypothetical protein
MTMHRPRHRKRILAVAALVVSAVACASPYVEAVPSGGIVTRSARTGVYTKKVIAKKAPDTLLAGDGTACRVVPELFDHTGVGKSVRCNWQ